MRVIINGLLISLVLLSGCRRASDKRKIETYLDTPEVREAMQGSYRAFCDQSLFMPKADASNANVEECEEGVRRSAMLAAACRHILRGEGTDPDERSPAAYKREKACLESFGVNTGDGGLGWGESRP